MDLGPKRWQLNQIKLIKTSSFNQVYLGVSASGQRYILRKMPFEPHKQALFVALSQEHLAGFVTILDLEVQGGTLWILEKWIRESAIKLGEAGNGICGETLEHQIQEALKIVIGLERLYRHSGILHLDLKPSNLLRDEWGQWHVIDFGSGISAVQITNLRAIEQAGTLGYISPERWVEPNWIGPQTDLYAFSMTLIQIWSNRGGRAHELIEYLNEWCSQTVIKGDEGLYQKWREGLMQQYTEGNYCRIV